MPSSNNYVLSDVSSGLNFHFIKGGENKYADPIKQIIKNKNFKMNNDNFCNAVNI